MSSSRAPVARVSRACCHAHARRAASWYDEWLPTDLLRFDQSRCNDARATVPVGSVHADYAGAHDARHSSLPMVLAGYTRSRLCSSSEGVSVGTRNALHLLAFHVLSRSRGTPNWTPDFTPSFLRVPGRVQIRVGDDAVQGCRDDLHCWFRAYPFRSRAGAHQAEPTAARKHLHRHSASFHNLAALEHDEGGDRHGKHFLARNSCQNADRCTD